MGWDAFAYSSGFVPGRSAPGHVGVAVVRLSSASMFVIVRWCCWCWCCCLRVFWWGCCCKDPSRRSKLCSATLTPPDPAAQLAFIAQPCTPAAVPFGWRWLLRVEHDVLNSVAAKSL